MKKIIEKLAQLEQKIAIENGHFNFFALFLREDAQEKWDLLVAAPWIGLNKTAALREISENVQKKLAPEELLKLARIVIIDEDNPGLDALQRAVKTEHRCVEIRDSSFFELPIKHAYLITSQKGKENGDGRLSSKMLEPTASGVG